MLNKANDCFLLLFFQRFGGYDQEKYIYESHLIVLDAVEQCLANVKFFFVLFSFVGMIA